MELLMYENMCKKLCKDECVSVCFIESAIMIGYVRYKKL